MKLRAYYYGVDAFMCRESEVLVPAKIRAFGCALTA